MKQVVLLSILLLFSLGCKNKKHTLDEYQKAIIVFGEGGGFAGGSSSHMIFEDGQVLFEDAFDTAGKVDKGRIKKREVKKVLKELDKLQFSSIDYNHPGNMYRFISLQMNDSMHTVMWALQDKKINAAIPALYHKLTTLVTKSNE